MKDAFGQLGNVSIKAMIPRVITLFSKPAQFWDELAGEAGGVKNVLPTVLIFVGAVAVAQIIGGVLGALRLPSGFFVRFFLGWTLGAVFGFGMGILAWYLHAVLVNAFAKTFNATPGMEHATKVSLGTLMPMWVAGLLSITSVGWLASLAGLGAFGYSCYLFWLGLQKVVNAPKEKAVGYAAAVMGIYFVIMLVAFFITSAFTGCFLAGAVLG